jgi:hypothetical protein
LGKSTWQVVHDVPYFRENAGMALAEGGSEKTTNTVTTVNTTAKEKEKDLPFQFMGEPRGVPHHNLKGCTGKKSEVDHPVRNVTAIT